MVGIRQDLTRTLTRDEIMKAREEDAEKIKSGKVKAIRRFPQTKKGYSL